MTGCKTSSADFFEGKYAREPDPWSFASDSYENFRYDRTLAALAHRRYHRGFEPGCSIGVLTGKLASVCDMVEAIDFSSTAIAHARVRCSSFSNIAFRCQSLPERLPVSGFDLLVLSEIGYYFTSEAWRDMCNELTAPMIPGSILLGVHWLGHSADHRISGDTVHTILHAQPTLKLEFAERHDTFRLERWVRI